MKLVEIKNSLAKSYYEPVDFKLVLSDFLTIDDGNQKILAQVVSIESTNNELTNCAVLKFSLDLNNDGSFSAYRGYAPSLDALVSLTPQKVLQDIFSDEKTGVVLGQLTNSSDLCLKVKQSLLNNFLYIQSDRHEQKQEITSKILDFNNEQNLKTLYLDFVDLCDYENYSTLTLGKDFKLPIDTDVLNYIYENDLTGLTEEQKTIVQDIIIEIQEYINTLETGFIPFDTLLNVINEIYESDKSLGVILLRNKLLKYKQTNIFASDINEILSLQNSLNSNNITVLKMYKPEKNWQSETLSFILDFIQDKYYLIFEADDETIKKEQINKIFANKNINPIVISKYDIDLASYIKSFTKNLILYKPLSQQRAFATYNSFLGKLSQKEFIISGENTYYTPLIIRELPEQLLKIQEEISNQKLEDEEIVHQISEIQKEIDDTDNIVVEPVDEEIEAGLDCSEVNQEFDSEYFEIQNTDSDELSLEEDITNIIELGELVDSDDDSTNYSTDDSVETAQDTIEQEIARDVDKMFYSSSIEQNNDISEEIDENIVDLDVDLVNTIEANDDLLEDDLFSDSIDETQKDVVVEDDLDFIDSLENTDTVEQTVLMNESNILLDEQNIDSQVSQRQEYNVNKKYETNVPVYETELDTKADENIDVEFAEGNIVYHEKYGRGVVEQIMSYGNKTFCAILFDNVGRRLIDPNGANLRQM